MEVIIQHDAPTIAHLVADSVVALLTEKPDAVLGVATGSSPLAVYDELVRRHEAGDVTFARASAFALDEYVGLPPDHPQLYRTVLLTQLVDRIDLPPHALHTPDGGADDVAAACAEYERRIADAGGVDLQLLGIGTDGHVAFNEPGSSFTSRTRLKTLTARTRQDNARFFDDDVDAVPRHCLTQGIGTILEARHLVLIATGEAKAEAVQQLVEGPMSAMWPATALQTHPHLTVLLDDAAASRLRNADYYRDAFAGKPAWQGI